MRPSFFPRLINNPFDDPGLFIPFQFEKRAVMFDLGDIRALSPRDVLKTSHVFITHTHMDHFIGFDTMLRLLLGREKDLYLYGPEGLIANVAGKLAGFSWNLVGNYTNRFTLHVSETCGQTLVTRKFHCHHAFLPLGEPTRVPFSGTLHEEPGFSVSAAVLDHCIPCLGLTLQERFHVNIKKARLVELGLNTGPWLNRLKTALFSGAPPDSVFQLPREAVTSGTGTYALGTLSEKIATITPGQKVTYIVDVVYNDTNVEKIVALSRNTDHLFIEAAFLDKDRSVAKEKYHLTARQAGTIAREANAKQLTVFHFSPRYSDLGHLLEQEALSAFGKR